MGKCCTQKERIEIRKLLIEFQDVSSWSYEDLKNFMHGKFKHEIPLKSEATPLRQKKRNYNPTVEGEIFKEIDKMLQARIIFPIHHSAWVASIVPVRKNNGEIRICVDFRNLNQASLKDNYVLSNRDHLLQIVTGSEIMSMLDGFPRYNQIQVDEVDQIKTTFTTSYGTFAHSRMPFGLINASTTFQHGMNLAFGNLKDKIIVIYLDDLAFFSKRREDHTKDLERVLQRCRDHGVSLNPKKSIFCVMDGELLGHIISQQGVKIDPEKVKSIQQLSFPLRKTRIKSFFGQENFLRSFLPDFS